MRTLRRCPHSRRKNCLLYDVPACAQECNKRTPNPIGGACQYFNIWHAVVNGTPATYTCSMYFHLTDATMATNTGQGSLKVTLSRGYKRTNYIVDGSFETVPPALSPCPFSFFCYLPSSATWNGLSSPTGTLDATIFLYQPLAHFGISFGLLGSATLSDSLPGTLAPSSALHTLPGKKVHHRLLPHELLLRARTGGGRVRGRALERKDRQDAQAGLEHVEVLYRRRRREELG